MRWRELRPRIVREVRGELEVRRSDGSRRTTPVMERTGIQVGRIIWWSSWRLVNLDEPDMRMVAARLHPGRRRG